MMWKQSVWSSIIASNIAANHMKPYVIRIILLLLFIVEMDYSVVLTGAKAALDGTPGT